MYCKLIPGKMLPFFRLDHSLSGVVVLGKKKLKKKIVAKLLSTINDTPSRNIESEFDFTSNDEFERTIQ